MTNRLLRGLYCCLLSLTTIWLISGCSSAPEPIKTVPEKRPAALANFPLDSQFRGKDTVDIQLALADRNLYMDINDEIKMLSTEQCALDISAHRGDFRQPESGQMAIASALVDNFNSVEIDVMLLRDGTWVNHHDEETGRATVHYTGEKYKLNRMNLKQYTELKLRDKDTRELVNIRPITALEAFQTFAYYRHRGQSLNVEIKSSANVERLTELNQMLLTYVGQGHFYYSADDIRTLEKLRGINPNVYLGLVQKAHPTSVDILLADMKKGVKNDAYYLDNQRNFERGHRYGTKRYRSRYQDHTSSAALNKIQQKLGSHSGLHLDIRSFMQTPAVKARAKQRGMRVYTYTINGTAYHQQQLQRLTSNQLPNGAIVDATPFEVCQRLFSAAKPKGHYQPSSAMGKYIASLPIDADFTQFAQMQGYQSEGYYISLNHGLKRIAHTNVAVAAEHKTPDISKDEPFRFPTISDEKIERNNGETIIITLPSKHNEQ
ncbi:glycerophosphodiester phosphodiesterase [Shewanella sp. WXL01]|uniref:glycerophosphodiester phosphodiesterase n=1 Tax=Shewanella sp. WXL01 TaxID=2709721 RepID=UPI0014384430|nr:glycerophosphodiester phosphodiesterase family protein [Shewanella sp. WXL01]NKF50782.1 glycerophosphodiester phosphodiesterase [Shewanella sp. WXL01]